jgi:superfamily II DNA/RNA helicase
LIHISHQRKLSRGDGPIVLVLSPTRELAQQIQTVCDDFGDAFGVSSTCLFGGAPKGGQVSKKKSFYLQKCYSYLTLNVLFRQLT